jgi:hypothetical protein
LARAYLETGRRADAIALFETTLKRRELILGPDHPDTFASSLSLAGAYDSVGRWSDAEALCRRTLARRRKTVPPDSSGLAGDLASLAHHMIGRSRLSEGEPLAREALSIRRHVTPDGWERCEAMSQLGAALLGQERNREAEALVVGGYQGMKARELQIYAPDRFRLLDAAQKVVRLYESWGRRDLALAWKAMLGMPELPADAFARP